MTGDNPITTEIAALRRAKPQNAAEERVRATELCRLQGILEEAARRAVDANAVKRLSNGGGAVPPDVLSREVLGALAKGLYDWLGPILADIDKRIAAAEAKPMLRYLGVWDHAKVYQIGDFVTDDGSLFHCMDSNINVRPGSGQTWQLAVKRGRDGKR